MLALLESSHEREREREVLNNCESSFRAGPNVVLDLSYPFCLLPWGQKEILWS